MGEGTNRLTVSHDGGPARAAAPAEVVRRLDADIAAIREQLGGFVAELDRRRHEMFDLRLQVRRHALGAAITLASVAGAATGVVWLGIWQARRRRRARWRAAQLRDAVGRMVDHPERVAAERPPLGRIATAAISTALATLLNRVLGRAAEALIDRMVAAGERAGRRRRGVGPPAG
jgi:hypothetical protein